MEGIGKRRSRGLFLKDGIGRGGKREGREREERDKKGAQPALTIKIVPAPLASKHQFGRPVKMFFFGPPNNNIIIIIIVIIIIIR